MVGQEDARGAQDAKQEGNGCRQRLRPGRNAEVSKDCKPFARTRIRFKKKNGRDDRIRTCDILLPKQARYQAAPHPDVRLDESLYMINEPHDNGKRKDGERPG